MDTPKPRIGLLTTYNQPCGLATYADYLIHALGDRDIVIFAESVPASERLEVDPSNVVRSWKRNAQNLDALVREIDARPVDVLHLNCHYRFFSAEIWAELIRACRDRGIGTIAHVHNPFSIDPSLQVLAQLTDAVVVHTPENRLEVLANGAKPEHVAVIEHGVPVPSTLSREECRSRHGISDSDKLVVCFGFVQPHKGVHEVVDAVHRLRAEIPGVKLAILGGVHEEDPYSGKYNAAVKQRSEELHAAEYIRHFESFVPRNLVGEYLTSADAVVMNYTSHYFEASGALATALGCGAPTITSTAPPFARLVDTVFHVTAGFPLPLALRSVLTNAGLAQSLRDSARAWSEAHSWERVSTQFARLYADVADRARRAAKARRSSPTATAARGEAQLRVLMQNRSNARTHRGGDTVVMEAVAGELQKLGVFVDIDLEGAADPRRYDLVHLYNFATPQVTEAFAKRAVEAGTPFVVTTMYEDLPIFYNQMLAQFEVFQAYVNAGQPQERWESLRTIVQQTAPSARWENRWVAERAAALIATGERERQTLLTDYPNIQRVELYSCGCNIEQRQVGPERFRGEFGVSEFVLCVGRLETRKNQLALLKALEDSELTLVF
ncbi:MAG: glycosyltransferase, partial [Bdellovibrionales bacterium]|nr:glycosyltransferase [Bdellovibrionales bacterium]